MLLIAQFVCVNWGEGRTFPSPEHFNFLEIVYFGSAS